MKAIAAMRIFAVSTAVFSQAVPAFAGATGPRVHTDTTDAHACLVLDDGRYLAGTDGGLVVIDGGEVTEVKTSLDRLPGTRVRALARYGDRIYVGTEGGVAELRATARLELLREHKSAPVRAFHRDGSVLYVATWGEGVFKLGGRLHQVALETDSPAGRRVAALTSHRGELIAATADGIYALKKTRFERTHDLGAPVMAVYSTGDDLYAGTPLGLLKVGARSSITVANADTRGITFDGETIRVSTFGAGIQDLRDGRLVRPEDRPALKNARALSFQGGRACAVGHGGIHIREGGSWSEVSLPEGPPANDISALVADGRRLWVGTFDQGLAYYEGGVWNRFRHDAIDNKVNALAIQDGTLYVATSTGLSVVGEDGRVERYGVNSGLPARNVLSLTTMANGGVALGTAAGVALLQDGDIDILGSKQGHHFGNVWAIGEDSKGRLWVGTTRGIYAGRPGEKGWERFSVSRGSLRDDWVTAITVDGDQVFVGTYKGGVTQFDVGAGGDVTATLLGKAWVNPGGLARVAGALYAATMDGLLVWDHGAQRWQKPISTPGPDTTAIAQNRDGLWIASRRGLVQAPKNTRN